MGAGDSFDGWVSECAPVPCRVVVVAAAPLARGGRGIFARAPSAACVAVAGDRISSSAEWKPT